MYFFSILQEVDPSGGGSLVFEVTDGRNPLRRLRADAVVITRPRTTARRRRRRRRRRRLRG